MVIKSCPLLVKDTETCVGSSLASYFVLFSLISLVSFSFRWFRFVSFRFCWFRFVSFRFVFVYFVSFRFVSFLFRFALYRYPKTLRQKKLFLFFYCELDIYVCCNIRSSSTCMWRIYHSFNTVIQSLWFLLGSYWHKGTYQYAKVISSIILVVTITWLNITEYFPQITTHMFCLT
jgi:hypothetical protein